MLEGTETALVAPFDNLGFQKDEADSLGNLDFILSKVGTLGHELIFDITF